MPFTVPAGAIAGATFARFRVSTAGGLLATGLASDGEVEDYAATLLDATAPAQIEVALSGNRMLRHLNSTTDLWCPRGPERITTKTATLW